MKPPERPLLNCGFSPPPLMCHLLSVTSNPWSDLLPAPSWYLQLASGHSTIIAPPTRMWHPLSPHWSHMQLSIGPSMAGHCRHNICSSDPVIPKRQNLLKRGDRALIGENLLFFKKIKIIFFYKISEPSTSKCFSPFNPLSRLCVGFLVMQ